MLLTHRALQVKRIIGKKDDRRKTEIEKKVELELKKKKEAAVQEMWVIITTLAVDKSWVNRWGCS